MFGVIFNNPWTSTVGAAGAILGMAHALGVNLPIDQGALNSILIFFLGMISKDGKA